MCQSHISRNALEKNLRFCNSASPYLTVNVWTVELAEIYFQTDGLHKRYICEKDV